MKSKLLPLTIGGFGLGMTEFVMMGILPDIANDMQITIPAAGHFISAYALGVVFGAPILVAMAGKIPPKQTLAGLMLLFVVGNGLSVFAPNYEIMLLTRFIAGLPHGAFFGVGAVVAGRLAGPGKEAQAVSLMFAGLTFANIIGVPFGTYIGHNFSWRITFAIIVLVGFLAALSIKLWLPKVPASKDADWKKELKVFSRLEPWLILIICVLGNGGFFAWFSYITPLLTEVAGFSSNAVTWVLVLAGTGMAVGNLIGGKLADRVSPLKATCFLLLAMACALVIITFAAEYKASAVLMTFVTGAIAFALASPTQMLMIHAAKGSEMIAASVSQCGFNLGNAIGAYLGGLPIAAGFGYTSPEWVGAMLVIGAFLFSLQVMANRAKAIKKEHVLL